ncbi:hypothetical protein BC629DRAFT_1444006 [Irpex lacteus]|nr:hypothetical protein BC629DRAFT_1444006 [Irpex lacteus]
MEGIGWRQQNSFLAQLAQCIPSLSSEEVLDLAELTRACLRHIQQQELAVAFPDWDWYKNEPQPEYDDWLPLFKEEETLFDDSLIELIGMIYLLASGRVSDMSDATEDVYQISYRAKMLGLVERADCVILASGSVVA